MLLQEFRAARTRGLITAAAADQFLENGFLGASMDEIAAAAVMMPRVLAARASAPLPILPGSRFGLVAATLRPAD